MFARTGTLRALLTAGKMAMPQIQIAGLKDFGPPPHIPIPEYPERRKLPIMPKVPQYPGNMRPFKMQKKLKLMRGPELLHNDFIHKQFGIIALRGGRLKHGHFEMIRLTIGKKMDINRMFAYYRVDPPWQPISRKGQGQRMGGGKGAIDHYATPVKADRVIVEVGGNCEFFEVKRFLDDIAAKLPFAAIALSYEELQARRKEEAMLEETNANPWTFKYIVQNNLGGCHNWVSPRDRIWFNKYR